MNNATHFPAREATHAMTSHGLWQPCPCHVAVPIGVIVYMVNAVLLATGRLGCCDDVTFLWKLKWMHHIVWHLIWFNDEKLKTWYKVCWRLLLSPTVADIQNVKIYVVFTFVVQKCDRFTFKTCYLNKVDKTLKSNSRISYNARS